MKGISLDITKDRLDKLKEIIPEVFSENKIDIEKLKLAIGEDINVENERYVLNWAGKSEAFKVLQTPSYATLSPVVEESVNFDSTENIFIEGENLEVLKILQKSYYGKIKMIYIDPPYNTGNDSFIYPDKFSESKDEYLKRIGDKDEEGLLTKEGLFRKNSKESGRYHSNWLSMMYPRLFLARNLLRDDGVIFVSIDDNEVHNLRLIMNEIFGEENFVAEIPWKGKGGGADNKYLMTAHEYILFYAKDKNFFRVGEEIKENELFPKYDENKKRYYKTQLARKWGSNSRRIDRPNLYYPIITPDGKEYFPKLPNGEEGCWRWSKQRMEDEIKNNNIDFVRDGDDWIIYEKLFAPLEGEYNTKKYSTWFDKFGTTATGTNEILDLFGEKIFDFPKPTLLLKTLLIISNVDDGDYVLDFFAGSGTLAHSVLDLNLVDNINRRFILVQMPELAEIKSSLKTKTISIADICRNRIKKTIEKKMSVLNKQELDLDDNNFDLGFKSFLLKSSNFIIWRSDFINNETDLSEQLEVFENHKKEKSSEIDVLYELMLKSGYELTAKVEKLGDFYSISDNDLVIALSKFDKKICSDIIKLKPRKCITLDILFKGNDKLKTNTVLQFKDAGIEFKTI